jgi:hypothetical protein
MKKPAFCECGSGQPSDYYCTKGWHNTSYSKEIIYPTEREEVIKLLIAKQFQMSRRGRNKFYGNDLTAWQSRKPNDPNRKEFTLILNQFMDDCLRDNCPKSWKECDQSFWEELIAAYWPKCFHISEKGQEHLVFLIELRKFAKWIDKKEKTQIETTIKTLTTEIKHDLSMSESILNQMIEQAYPGVLSGELDFTQALEKEKRRFDSYHITFPGLFEVSDSKHSVFLLSDLQTGDSYHVMSLPESLKPGFLVQGVIGHLIGLPFWEWCLIDGVFPPQSKKYFPTEEYVDVL